MTRAAPDFVLFNHHKKMAIFKCENIFCQDSLFWSTAQHTGRIQQFLVHYLFYAKKGKLTLE